jgi:hypothetical protein
MRRLLKFGLALLVVSRVRIASAQDLTPRAYVITPVRANAVTLTYTYSTGNVLFAGAVPITDATANIHIPVFGFYHALGFFGHSANITVLLPYSVGDFQGKVFGSETNAYRSGLLDSVYRFSVNLKGGPAMNLDEFRKWRQKTLIGASLRVVAPTGQYDSRRLLNYGSNRWAFKPELGFSQRHGHWLFDAYGAVWFFTANPEFFSHNQFNPGTIRRTEAPVGAFEGHLSYDVRPRFWVSLDGNFWTGGRVSLNGVENSLTLQRNSRLGATLSVPITSHQQLKFSYNNGTYIQYGGNYQNISAAWQYSWIGGPD